MPAPTGLTSAHDDVARRFWAKVDRAGPVIRPDLGPCWVWTAGRDQDGYGLFKASGRTWRATRFLLGLDFGDPRHALHHCDNRACIRPEHLYLGSNADNARDREARGRAVIVRGERRGHARIRDADVEPIRLAAKAGEPHRVIGERYGLSRSAVGQIVNGKKYAHVFADLIERRTAIGRPRRKAAA